MDRAQTHESLFSRGPSTTPDLFQAEPAPAGPAPSITSLQPRVSPSLSHRESAQSTSPNHLDALFHNLNVSSAPAASTSFPPPPHSNNSAPTTPMSVASGSSTFSAADRQTALLSLLGTVGPAQNTQANPPPQPQQIPTPPGSAHSQHAPSTSESQGRVLLEQLMGAVPVPSEATPTAMAPSGNMTPQAFYGPLPQPDQEYYHAPPQQSYNPYDQPLDNMQSGPMPPSPPQQQQLPPPSPPKSIFEFVSPFDALASGSSSGKKKPVLSPQQSMPGPGESLTSWSTTMSADPKRKSVENLMEQLTRGQAPLSSSPTYDPYYGEEVTPQAERMVAPPLQSPRASPPRMVPQVQQQQQQQQRARPTESPLGQAPGTQSPMQQGNRRSSPVPRGGFAGKGGKGKSRNYPAGNAQTQSVVFDVSQPLDEIQAQPDYVKSTAIALVKVDQNFLPGTTIGATNWVAYAMTKGRVRVISRSSGDRTLLQLPPTFPPTTVVNDMAVFGNRLAGVTSDGGFIVWELPDVITDDVLGRILLCVFPALDGEALHSVKWHPKQLNHVAVASESKIYLLDIAEAYHAYNGEPISQNDLPHVSDVFTLASPLVAFDFDVFNYGIATISEDSVLSYWSTRDRMPYWTSKIPGDDMPSSLISHEAGVIIGRRKGTVFQLVPLLDKTVIATVRFVNGRKDDPDMFGHANYDARIQTLWVANNRRDSMIACKIVFEPGFSHEEPTRAYFDQVVEFGGPKPTIHFVILTADADPTGEEAHAACVAAKVPPGDLALVAFSVHSSGVDQILIRKEWYDMAVGSAPAKYPQYTPPPVAPAPALAPASAPESKSQRSSVQSAVSGPQNIIVRDPAPAPPPRAKTPQSDEPELEANRDEPRPAEPKNKGGKGKNVGWKKEDANDSGRDKGGKSSDSASISENQIGNALSKEIRKLEDSLHTRLGRLVGKELDKQHQRMEEVRAGEQAADFQRQEKILKLISTELTKNTTRVVEMAVKSEVQNSVLPSLENITRTEVKSALDGQVTKALSDAIRQSLPAEVERLLLRSDVSNQIARNFASSVTPAIERHVKDTVTKTLIPAYTQQFSQLHQDITQELRQDLMSLKQDVVAWQTEAFRAQDSLIRELEQSVRSLADQVKYLSVNAPRENKGSPSLSGNGMYNHPRPLPQTVPSYPPVHGQYMQQPSSLHQQAWFSPTIAAPQASHPALPPPAAVAPQQQQRMPPIEEWDDTYLAVLGTQDPQQLRELLARSNPEIVMPLKGPCPLSQAVVLTLVHRLSATVSETSPADESFKVTLWWLLRASQVLNHNHALISPYIGRVLPNVQQMLNTTKQRLSIIPGSSPVLGDAVRTLGEVQEALSRSRQTV